MGKIPFPIQAEESKTYLDFWVCPRLGFAPNATQSAFDGLPSGMSYCCITRAYRTQNFLSVGVAGLEPAILEGGSFQSCCVYRFATPLSQKAAGDPGGFFFLVAPSFVSDEEATVLEAVAAIANAADNFHVLQIRQRAVDLFRFDALTLIFQSF